MQSPSDIKICKTASERYKIRLKIPFDLKISKKNQRKHTINKNRPLLRAVLLYASDETEFRLLFAASRFLFTRFGFRRFTTWVTFFGFRCGFFGVVHRLFSIGGTITYIGRKEILFKKMFGIKKNKTSALSSVRKHHIRRKKEPQHFRKQILKVQSIHFVSNNKCRQNFSARYLFFKYSKQATPQYTGRPVFYITTEHSRCSIDQSKEKIEKV